MRVLFDQATPVPIREFLIGHTVRTAAQEHWDTLKNGDLLTAAEHAGRLSRQLHHVVQSIRQRHIR